MNFPHLLQFYGEEYVTRAIIYHEQLCDKLELLCLAGRKIDAGWVDGALDLIERARGKK